MSSRSILNTNKLVRDMHNVISFVQDPKLIPELESLDINWASGDIITISDKLRALLKEQLYIDTQGNKDVINNRGIIFLGKLLVDIQALQSKGSIYNKYRIESVIASGNNSVTFKARHEYIGRLFALKVIRPGKGADMVDKLKQIGKVGGEPYLVHPIDYLSIDHMTVSGNPLKLQCWVFPYIEGKTLDQFLAETPPISPYFIGAFLKQIATALAALESKNLYHGDFHSGNILVTWSQDNKILFQIIDVSCGISDASPYQYHYSDYQHFQEHLWRSLSILQDNLPRMSIRKHLGPELYLIVEHVLTQKTASFKEILALLKHNVLYEKYRTEKSEFIRDKFRSPNALGLLRYEEFTDPEVAVDLFEPYPELLSEISNFGNAILYGHRGSGKSTYLAALACFPKVRNPIFDMRLKFGIFFACRQGEFKQLSDDFIIFDMHNFLWVKHILVLKIVRRVIDTLRELEQSEHVRRRLSTPRDYAPLYEFLNDFVEEGAILNYDEAVSPLDNLHASLLRDEMLEIDNLFSGSERRKSKRYLTEIILKDFFNLIRSIYLELRDTQFYLLFDDAGHPNLPRPTQYVLNEIIRCTNSTYCVKLSAEKFSYEFKDTTKKVLEESHDYASFDISAQLSLGSGYEPARPQLEAYFKKIISKRLGNYKSSNISDYIGEEIITSVDLVERLATARRNAYYCGWKIIWQLADRTTRNLLELVSAVLNAAEVKEDSVPNLIPPHVQSRAIKNFSEKKFKSLLYIPGEITIAGRNYGLGIKLYEFTASFGNIARAYLKNKRPIKDSHGRTRYEERLAVERDDAFPLNNDARAFLECLIRYAVVDDSKLVTSRDDQIKKPIFVLNRIYCPAFGISFRRSSHLRLSKHKFENLLLDPLDFVKKGNVFLENLDSSEINECDLFGKLTCEYPNDSDS